MELVDSVCDFIVLAASEVYGDASGEEEGRLMATIELPNQHRAESWNPVG